MIEICALASGSNGNCYYIGNSDEAILVDAGIYYKRLVERMNDVGLDLSKVKAIFISHEHADHVQGVRVITKKLKIPAIFSQHTYLKAHRKYQAEQHAFFEAGENYSIGKINVFPFKKQHDARHPHSFRVECEGKHIGVMTDIGVADEILEEEFARCHAVFLESNYDKNMLWKGHYPFFLKRRVDSEKGHLSNEQALQLVQGHASPELETIFLSHISDSNNTYELALKNFDELKEKYDIRLTSRSMASDVVRL